jgi:hypothetical protein
MMSDTIIETISNFWADLGSPIFTDAVNWGAKASQSITASKSGLSKFTALIPRADLINQENLCTAAKVVLACIGTACITAGGGLIARTIARGYGIRDLKKVIQPVSLIPLSQGEKELISGPVGLIQRVKSVFTNKVLPGLVGTACVGGGIFILAHADYFSKAFKKS